MTVPLLGRRRQAQRRNPAADPGEGFGAAARAPYYERVFGTTILEHAGENEGGTAASRGGLGRTAERFPPGGRIGSPTGAARPLAALARLEAAMRIATRRLLLPLVAVLAAVAILGVVVVLTRVVGTVATTDLVMIWNRDELGLVPARSRPGTGAQLRLDLTVTPAANRALAVVHMRNLTTRRVALIGTLQLLVSGPGPPPVSRQRLNRPLA